MSANVDRVNELHSKYAAHFVTGLHNLLWQLLVNECTKGRTVALTVIVGDGCAHEVVVAEADGGYIPTAAAVCQGYSYDRAVDVVEELSRELFGYDKLQQAKVVARSVVLGRRGEVANG